MLTRSFRQAVDLGVEIEMAFSMAAGNALSKAQKVEPRGGARDATAALQGRVDQVRRLAHNLSAVLPEQTWRAINIFWMGFHARVRGHGNCDTSPCLIWLCRQEEHVVNAILEIDTKLLLAVSAGIVCQRLATTRQILRPLRLGPTELAVAHRCFATYAGRTSPPAVPKFVAGTVALAGATLFDAAVIYEQRLQEALSTSIERLGATAALTRIQIG